MSFYLQVVKNQKCFLNSVVKAPDRFTPMPTFDCLLPLCLISFSSLVLQAFTEKEVTTFAEDVQVYKPLYEDLYFYTDTQFKKLSAGKGRTNEIFYSTFKHTVFASAIAFTETVSGTSYFREVEEPDLKSAFEREKGRLTATAALVFDNQESIKTLEAQNARLEEMITESEIVSAATIFYIDEVLKHEKPLEEFVRQQLEDRKGKQAPREDAKPNAKPTVVDLQYSDKEGDDEQDNQEPVPFSGRRRPHTRNTTGYG